MRKVVWVPGVALSLVEKILDNFIVIKIGGETWSIKVPGLYACGRFKKIEFQDQLYMTGSAQTLHDLTIAFQSLCVWGKFCWLG